MQVKTKNNNKSIKKLDGFCNFESSFLDKIRNIIIFNKIIKISDIS